MTDLKFIALGDIEPIKNYRDSEPVSEKDPDVIELSQSLLKLGMLQPVLLRPKAGKPGKYELIFGHRRLTASKVAKLETIPSNIKEVADSDVLELQVTENLQRKDVHPMDEAVAFRSLMAAKSYSVDDIAAKFGKKTEFVAHRLKLCDLVPELQKVFIKGGMPVGHAFAIARLRKEDQLKLRGSVAEPFFNSTSLSDLQDWINRNLLRQLSSAPFKRDDATLVPSAGPCTTCPKRSGCGNLLFADLKEDDRCFDAKCFDFKQELFFLRHFKKTIETKPEVHLIAGEPNKLPKDIKELLRQMNVTLLESSKYQGYRYGKYTREAKAMKLDGYGRGKTETIYLEGTGKKDKAPDGKPTKRTLADVSGEIAGLKQRQDRALELDSEKVYTKIKLAIEDPSVFKTEPLHLPLNSQDERNAMAVALIDKMQDSEYEEKAMSVLGIKGMDYVDDLEMDDIPKLKVTIEQLYCILRLFILATMQTGMEYKTEVRPFLLIKVLRAMSSVNKLIDEAEAAQAVESDKRIASAKKRMDNLVKEKKEFEGKKTTKAETKKPAPKKIAIPSKKSGASKGKAKLLVDDEEGLAPDFNREED